MDAQYGLLFLLALKPRGPRDRSAKAEDAYYARFSQSPLKRLARFVRSRPSATKRLGSGHQEKACDEARSPGVKGLVPETDRRVRASGPMSCKAA
jgi:hypothetical protein